MGSTDSLGRPRPPAQFHAPPPPDSPPPPETPCSAVRSYNFSRGGIEVVDSSIQVHAGSISPDPALLKQPHLLEGKHAALTALAASLTESEV